MTIDPTTMPSCEIKTETVKRPNVALYVNKENK